jgi:hypothetical protein
MKLTVAEQDYQDLKREVESLRRKIDELERHRSPVRWHARSGVMVALVCIVLALSLMGAQSRSGDALFVDQNGNVGINQPKPEAPLDVNGNTMVRGDIQVNGKSRMQSQEAGSLDVKGDAVVGGRLNARAAIPPYSAQNALPAGKGLIAGDSDLYFSTTSHQHTGQGNQTGFAAIENAQNYNSLMILGRSTTAGRMVGMWDRVGIGKGNPQAPLDVNGEIRGKPWISEEYEVIPRNGIASRQMTKSDHTVCFLTTVSGKFMGGGENVAISERNGYWFLDGSGFQTGVLFRARCMGAPDNSW